MDLNYGVQTALLVLFLLVGLLAYERWGLRLGGVLVLPLLTLYILGDPRFAAVFAFSAATTYAVGELIHRRTLIYGRRIFSVFLISSCLATACGSFVLRIPLHGVVLPIMPGLFSFNLHREGQPVRGVVIFSAGVAVFLALGVFLQWAVDNLSLRLDRAWIGIAAYAVGAAAVTLLARRRLLGETS